MGKPMSIAVCDEDGVLKAFRRMDGAALLSVQIAQDKAYTAISFGGMATHEWFDFIKNDLPSAPWYRENRPFNRIWRWLRYQDRGRDNRRNWGKRWSLYRRYESSSSRFRSALRKARLFHASAPPCGALFHFSFELCNGVLVPECQGDRYVA